MIYNEIVVKHQKQLQNTISQYIYNINAKYNIENTSTGSRTSHCLQ